jgi:hypothetical protein
MKINQIISWIIVLILVFILIFKNPQTIDISDEQPYRDSINLLLEQISERDCVIIQREFIIDSLTFVKSKNHKEYVTIFKYINRDNITHSELDSIVRLYANIN